MKNLVNEIHRRSLWQVLGIYLAASWIVLQVVDVVGNNFGLPEWVAPAALILLLLGLPVVLATAFVQEGLTAKEPPPAPQSLADAGEVPPALPRAPSGARGLFTWRRALLGGVAAFALLGLAAAGWLAMRALGIGPAATLVAQGVLDEREPIVVADFASPPDEPDLGEALTEALRIELGNSTMLDVVDGAAITGALRRMRRDPAEGLARPVALELAVREGYKAVIAGEVRKLAGAYQLSAEVLQASDGASLAGFRETARDADGLIEAIDNLSKDLRQKAGESIRTVRGSEPLDEVSTASLDALRLYSEGVRAFDLDDYGRARSLLEEAVAIDSGFAMAHRKLGAVYQNLRQNQALVDAMSAAYRYRERLTRPERLHVEAAYHMFVDGDRQAAIRAFEQLLELDPDDTGAANNLAVALDGSDPAREAELYRRGVDAGAGVISYTNLVNPLANLGRYDEALAVLDEGEQRFPDAAGIALGRVRVNAAAARYAEARSAIAALEEGYRGTYEAGVLGPWWSIALDGLAGRLGNARRTTNDVLPKAREGGSASDLVNLAMMPAYQRLYAAGDRPGAVSIAEGVLQRHPLDSFAPTDRQTLLFADFFARAGDAARAERLLDKWERDRIAGDPSPFEYAESRALADLAGGRVPAAIEALERLDSPAPARCLRCLHFDLGLAYDRAGDPDAAIDAYERHVNARHAFRLLPGHYSLPYAHERLGALYAERASETDPPSSEDLARAAEHYGRFVELWTEADEELQPRVRAARARLEELRRRGVASAGPSGGGR